MRSTTSARSRSPDWHDPRLTVVGSINLDLVARVERLPRPGETVTGATFTRVPGGKGANQAVAAARLGAEVTLIGCVGDDAFGRDALVELERAGVALDRLRRIDGESGVAFITVDASGENEIVVAPGANLELRPEDVDLPDADGVLCQLEIPLETVAHVARAAAGRFFLNAAPARGPVPPADVTVVNRYELAELPGRDGLVAVTNGAEGAVLLEDGEEVARAEPPPVDARRRHRRGRRVHGVPRRLAARGPRARGGAAPRVHRRRARRVALRRADVAADRRGGGRAAVTVPILIDCDPGPRRRDRDPARARVARGRGARRHHRRRQPDARQDDAERAEDPRARRPHRHSRGGRRGPPAHAHAAHGRARARRERPRRARPAGAVGTAGRRRRGRIC